MQFRYGPKKEITLNPLQILVKPLENSDSNILICGKTSSGKTVCGEILASKVLFDEEYKDKVILYLGSYKSLCQERLDDWMDKNHSWADVPISVISGDYFYDTEKILEIEKAKILVITPESCLSCLVNKSSDKAIAWISRVALCICDELHEVSNGDRGPNYENALVELARENPQIQFIGLSGTLPNYNEFLLWLSKLNGKKTEFISSDYRPVELEHNFIPHKKEKNIADTENIKINMIIQLLKRPDKQGQQFLICVFKKTFGTKITAALQREGINAEFHNANATKAQRNKIETNFKNGIIRALISTSTLFTGVNLPATNVIITAPEAGGGDIPAYVLQQAAGRAGRPKYDTEGYVYYFIPANDLDHHKNRIIKGENILSCMGEIDVIHQHFIRAVYRGRISNIADFEEWYQHTLAFVQLSYNKERCHELALELVKNLRSWGMLVATNDPSELKISYRGKVCSQMLLNPGDFFKIITNFNKYFSLNSPTDVDLARAIGCLDEFATDYLGFADKAVISPGIKNIVPEKYQKAVHTALAQISGREVESLFLGTLFQLKDQLPRYLGGALRVCGENKEWDEEKIPLITIRLMRGMNWASARLAASKFTKREIRILSELGIYTYDDALRNKDLIATALKSGRIDELGLS